MCLQGMDRPFQFKHWTNVLAELENIYTDHTDSTDRLIYK